mgnify:CR=1 FL=1
MARLTGGARRASRELPHTLAAQGRGWSRWSALAPRHGVQPRYIQPGLRTCETDEKYSFQYRTRQFTSYRLDLTSLDLSGHYFLVPDEFIS